MKQEADIVSNPASHFDGPVDLARSDAIPHEVKHAALATWEQHAEALDVAADEGMAPAPNEQPLRPELEAALGIVADKSGEDGAEATTTSLSALPTQKDTIDMTPDKKDMNKLASDANQVGDDIGALARAAIDAIRKATDEFASKAGASKNEAVDAVRHASQAAISSFGAVAGEARAVTENGLDSIGKQVVRNPLAALAVAAGVGLVLGLLSRTDQRR